jgi:hypothetical protein
MRADLGLMANRAQREGGRAPRARADVQAAWQRSAVRWIDGIAPDGKTLRGARRLGASDADLLSACSH